MVSLEVRGRVVELDVAEEEDGAQEAIDGGNVARFEGEGAERQTEVLERDRVVRDGQPGRETVGSPRGAEEAIVGPVVQEVQFDAFFPRGARQELIESVIGPLASLKVDCTTPVQPPD